LIQLIKTSYDTRTSHVVISILDVAAVGVTKTISAIAEIIDQRIICVRCLPIFLQKLGGLVIG
jgi:hypothetical protein